LNTLKISITSILVGTHAFADTAPMACSSNTEFNNNLAERGYKTVFEGIGGNQTGTFADNSHLYELAVKSDNNRDDWIFFKTSPNPDQPLEHLTCLLHSGSEFRTKFNDVSAFT